MKNILKRAVKDMTETEKFDYITEIMSDCMELLGCIDHTPMRDVDDLIEGAGLEPIVTHVLEYMDHDNHIIIEKDSKDIKEEILELCYENDIDIDFDKEECSIGELNSGIRL